MVRHDITESLLGLTTIIYNMQTLMTITTGEIYKSLYGANYPINKRQIIDLALERKASYCLKSKLKELPEGIYFGILDIQNEVMERTWDEDEDGDNE
jgi:hypothetical protein